MTELEEAQLPPALARTAVSEEIIAKVVAGITTFPSDFALHPKLKGFVAKRKEVLSGGTADWATAEALAFGSLVLEGTPVRLSGQDSGAAPSRSATWSISIIRPGRSTRR